MGYHIKQINKGILGELSKIREELEELEDSLNQDCAIMALVELSDLYGAINHFLKKNYPNIKMSDLEKMSNITERAFKDGSRI